MPRSKPSETIVHRIELGGYERERLEDLVASARIYSVGMSVSSLWDDPDAPLRSPLTVIAFIEAIATALEVMGIETPIPTPVDAYQWFQGFYEKKKQDIESGKVHLDVAEAVVEGAASIRPGFWIGGIIEDLLRGFAQPYQPPTEFGGVSASERAEGGY